MNATDGISERLCTYAWDRACSLHSLMSLMRLLYLENTNENSRNKTLNNFLYVVPCNTVYCRCYIYLIVKPRTCIFVQPTLKRKSANLYVFYYCTLRFRYRYTAIKNPFRSSSCSYPLMLTNRSSAALWMWKTSSLNRQRQVELCRASFHRDNAAVSLFSTEWHRMKPTARTRTGINSWINRIWYESRKFRFQTYRLSTSPSCPEKDIRRASTDKRPTFSVKTFAVRSAFIVTTGVSHVTAFSVILTVSDCAGLSMVEGAEMRDSSWAFLHWSADRFLLG